eukprot:CAMPEP_0184687092 /NCGR_PEP_ID=MMETSP0312-20130426/25065_1 /TAXON_ID=31354 /ORGANISM="Compsopogon coeruleus, Strain SAG 36.94" /LENGTH=332 /DNA_ID=CAMNT_0027142827 /DNA_START=1 /DNA_END=999 /DNA_ORIENTATION=-
MDGLDQRSRLYRSGYETRFCRRPGNVVACNMDNGGRPAKMVDRVRVPAELGRHLLASEVTLGQTFMDSSVDGVVDVVIHCFPPDRCFGVFVLCGHGETGKIGMNVARRLADVGYDVSVYHEQSSASSSEGDGENTFTGSSLLRESGIAVLDFIPSTMDAHFDLVVDAVAGIELTENEQIVEMVVERISNSSRPVLSLDMPVGWDSDSGPTLWARRTDTFIKPDVLVSLGVPKLGSKMFAGMFHYLAGRLSPPSIEDLDQCGIRYSPLDLGSDLDSPKTFRLISTNPFKSGFGKKPGEVYGSPGQFIATLFTKQPKRTWVDVENDDDLWDELD